ncbi:MAG: glycosyltransferase 87 family protein [Candidatus Nanopelagicales bacterium]
MSQRAIRAAPWVLLAIAVLIKAAWYLPPWLGDFRVYHTAAAALLHGQPLYDVSVPYVDPTVNQGTLVFTYPPFAAVLVIPFAFLSASTAGLIFFVLNFVLLAVVCRIVGGQLEAVAGRTLPWSGWPLAVVLIAVALVERPVVHLFNLGQIGLVLMLMILLDTFVVVRGRGVLTGLATGIKVTPGLFLLLMATTRRWRQFWVGCATFAATVLVGFLIQPASGWRYWTELIFDSERVGNAARTDNSSVLGVVTRAVEPPYAQIVWLVIAVAVLAAGTWLATDWWRRNRLVSLCVMAVAGLVALPISWDHHWIWIIAIVPVFGLLALRGWRAGHRAAAAWAGLAAVTLFGVSVGHPESYAAKILVGTGELTPTAQLLVTGYSVAGLLILVAAWRARVIVPRTTEDNSLREPAKMGS